MSQWTIPRECAASSASQIDGTIASACSGVRRPALIACRKLTPSTYSMSR